ncbi:WSC-domain-containing protein [Mycena venus]|uniref:WSC-domain-containing protein n=1 Tax=Mycena venus TaxID=2733690 RepID=A0A8H7D916_9AGAR|nr:WSC-domain-containing protein [Mycena venus]
MFTYHLATVLLLAQLGISLPSVDVGSQGPTIVLEYKEWKSIGCQADSTSGRALKHLVAVASPTMTVESCLDSCQAGGYALGGVEFGDECYCGNALLYGYGTSTACNKPCSGNTSELCGGSKALNVYQFANTPFTTGPASAIFAYKLWRLFGCQDEQFPLRPRLLPHSPLVPIPGEQMTVERCLDGCEAAGYNAAALEAGQECYCDLVPSNNGGQPLGWESTNSFECADPCLANATEICGGTSGTIDTPTDMGRLTSYLTCDYFDLCDVF